ncbi:hypothetical protein B0H66DRAFT_615612 [Apodospora peruviana]|uniref:Uncharacterized protein n=1 Tax=Apodospora peruviana TaxID=516989 RepID=A0AAE0IHR4_9PEZI|nr:hypothetical protein B0H66DRAFT_615612 [Apodospora peruviana]
MGTKGGTRLLDWQKLLSLTPSNACSDPSPRPVLPESLPEQQRLHRALRTWRVSTERKAAWLLDLDWFPGPARFAGKAGTMGRQAVKSNGTRTDRPAGTSLLETEPTPRVCPSQPAVNVPGACTKSTPLRLAQGNPRRDGATKRASQLASKQDRDPGLDGKHPAGRKTVGSLRKRTNGTVIIAQGQYNGNPKPQAIVVLRYG